MTDGARCYPLSWEGSVVAMGDIFKPKNRGFEDQIEPFPYSFQGPTFGKIVTLLKAQKSPIILGWVHTDFLPEVNNPAFLTKYA